MKEERAAEIVRGGFDIPLDLCEAARGLACGPSEHVYGTANPRSPHPIQQVLRKVYMVRYRTAKSFR
jgi:hypothetical protein